MTRAELHQTFVTEYSRPPITPIAVPQDAAKTEAELSTVLPQSYLDFLQMHGAPFTPDILGLIVDRGDDMPDIREFLTDDEVVRNSRLYWSGGMSDALIGFASDSMGNMFCFRRQPKGAARPDDAEVWFFDHDFCTEHKVADSFDELIQAYVALKRPK